MPPTSQRPVLLLRTSPAATPPAATAAAACPPPTRTSAAAAKVHAEHAAAERAVVLPEPRAGAGAGFDTAAAPPRRQGRAPALLAKPLALQQAGVDRLLQRVTLVLGPLFGYACGLAIASKK